MRKKFGKIDKINKRNLGKLPDGPGVYGIYSNSKKLLKVGRAKRYRNAERIEENQKEIPNAKKFGFIPTETVKDAISLETKLIKGRKPKYNKETKGK